MTETELQNRIQKIGDDTLLELHKVEREYETKKLHYQTLIDTNLVKWQHKLQMTLAESGYIQEEEL